MIEQWKDIEKWDNLYQVSNHGRIKRKARKLIRVTGDIWTLPESVLKPIDYGKGNLHVKVRVNKILYHESINRLVSDLFHPAEHICVPYKDIRRSKLTHQHKGELIELWVNNPDIPITDLALRFGVDATRVSTLISDVWFYKPPRFNTEIIVKQSAINEEIPLREAV